MTASPTRLVQEHGATCGHVVRVVALGPKALARIERMRAQRVPYATRTRFDVSGEPRMTRPAIWPALANRPTTGGAK